MKNFFNFDLSFKHFKLIILTILIVFFISANKAWLNPDPNNGAIKINKKIPIMWQYIADVKFDLLTSAYFFGSSPHSSETIFKAIGPCSSPSSSMCLSK